MLEHLQALAIHCYYAGEIDAGRRACDRILSTPGVPGEIAMQARANRLWYTPTLGELADATYRQIEIEPAHAGWSLFNPTLILYEGDLVGIVRSSNYRIEAGQYVMPAEDGGRIRTQNLLVRYDRELVPVTCRPLAVEYPQTDYPVDGLEDCRLLKVGGDLGVSSTVRNVAPFDGRCRIATGTIDLATATVTGLRVLDGIATQPHEKNWMPILGRGGWLYACSHGGHVVTVDADPGLAGGWQVCQRSPAPPIAAEFRGGSQLVPWRDGWVAVIHEVAYLNARRCYEHRLVWFDANLRLAAISQPFAFREKQAIEFAAGLARHGDLLVMSFGVRDAEAWLVALAEEDAWRLLSAVTSA
jgi:predicted GH43/DUF377 family glycosyl hydrolase